MSQAASLVRPPSFAVIGTQALKGCIVVPGPHVWVFQRPLHINVAAIKWGVGESLRITDA